MADQEPTYIDFIVVGGGPAECMAAIRAKELNPDMDIIILEKAEISRSGAAGRGMDDLPAKDLHGLMKVFEAKAGLFCARIR